MWTVISCQERTSHISNRDPRRYSGSLQIKLPVTRRLGLGYSSGVRKLIGLTLGGVAVFNGIAILVANDCKTVSFDGQGSRVAIAKCFTDSRGALPGWLAGTGIILVGVIITILSVKN